MLNVSSSRGFKWRYSAEACALPPCLFEMSGINRFGKQRHVGMQRQAIGFEIRINRDGPAKLSCEWPKTLPFALATPITS